MARSSTLLKFRYRAEAAFLRTAIFLFRLVPVDMASAVMGFFWRKLAPFNSRHKRALMHLELALPETNEKQRQAIVAGMWDNLGRVAAETFHIADLMKQKDRFTVRVDERTEKFLEEDKGCVWVSLHTGNWELCVQPLVTRGHEVTGVYQALSNPITDEILRDIRKDLYRGGLHSKGHQTARKLISAVRRGGNVAIMADLRETRGIRMPFFGRSAYATPVPATLARACGVPIVVGRVVRTKGVHFRIEGRCIDVPVTDDRKADIEAATLEFHGIFEEWIRECPDQWMWIHRKWAPS
ncbi:lysophospholipid acyltransferase family protein [uncultured Roseibium sp.]|uniref:lysophospholipid acyltransferase family protein n=1 Tax=uncultured Roseibium sp. TaxID=1936171 RepID=UPI0032174925